MELRINRVRINRSRPVIFLKMLIKGIFKSAIYYAIAIAITIKFMNGLCDSLSPQRFGRENIKTTAGIVRGKISSFHLAFL